MSTKQEKKNIIQSEIREATLENPADHLVIATLLEEMVDDSQDKLTPEQITAIDSITQTQAVDTAYNEVTYASTITEEYNELEPNKQITLGGDLTYILTDATNAGTGMYLFDNTAGKTITLIGSEDPLIIEAGTEEEIYAYFINYGEGVVWFQSTRKPNVTASSSNNEPTIDFVSWHSVPFESRGGLSFNGNKVTRDFQEFYSDFINKLLIADGVKYIITDVVEGVATIDKIVGDFFVNNSNWGVYNKAQETKDGVTRFYNYLGNILLSLDNTGELINTPKRVNYFSNQGGVGDFMTLINGSVTIMSPSITEKTLLLISIKEIIGVKGDVTYTCVDGMATITSTSSTDNSIIGVIAFTTI